ncbi:expressed unknown protein [Seminavis robusta]|uniref:Uncharacterized protein n=1 Tax=Seminavis robusta TaxID=568900 RepID=A0A9N8DK29_9STRA|nr:expressed unknown protein [Seminavis robusta]|eukprot:Sro126_g060590.1 n/a (234) ;mRNA; f:80959-81660
MGQCQSSKMAIEVLEQVNLREQLAINKEILGDSQKSSTPTVDCTSGSLNTRCRLEVCPDALPELVDFGNNGRLRKAQLRLEKLPSLSTAPSVALASAPKTRTRNSKKTGKPKPRGEHQTQSGNAGEGTDTSQLEQSLNDSSLRVQDMDNSTTTSNRDCHSKNKESSWHDFSRSGRLMDESYSCPYYSWHVSRRADPCSRENKRALEELMGIALSDDEEEDANLELVEEDDTSS